MAERVAPPPAVAGDVVDDFFGTSVPDPYRSLEDAEDTGTIEWWQAQNARADAHLRSLPQRRRLETRLTALWRYTECSAPERHGTRSFFLRRDLGQDLPVLYAQEDGGELFPVIDPNQLSDDGSMALIGHQVSHGGDSVAYSLSAAGSKWTTVHVRTVGQDRDESDVLTWTAFPSIAWEPDGSAFYYDRFPPPAGQPTAEQTGTGGIYRHRLGTSQAEDVLVFAPGIEGALCRARTSTDGSYLFVSVAQGTDTRNGISVRPMASQDPLLPLVLPGEASFALIDTVGREAFFVTTLDAPQGRIIAVDLEQPAREHWREVVPEGEGIIESSLGMTSVRIAGGRLVVPAIRNVQHEIRVYNLAGEEEPSVALPAAGSVIATTGRPDVDDFFFVLASFLQPPTVFRYDVATRDLTVVHRPVIPFEFDRYETRQVVYTSPDGTQAPMSVTHRKDLALDGRNRALLHAYGGFGVNLLPTFSSSVLAWLEEGGVYAVATLRGGGEFGEAWHEAGMLANKQNVFDDFIAAGEQLISTGYTVPASLAITGMSNGGLLVASCLVQRPELYGAVVCEVPVIDMLRYHRFSSGIWWVAEYGQADAEPEHFRFLYAYSPLHNVRAGTCYPPTLIATAQGDDHVVPAHAFKFAATLQAAQCCDQPILLQVRPKIGHGGGKPTWKSIEEAADIYAFLLTTLELPAT
jgi:prolyl oligopeptidase